MKLNSSANPIGATTGEPSARLRARIIGLLFGLVLIPLLVLIIIGGLVIYGALQREAAARLYTTSSYRQGQLERWVDGLSAALYKVNTDLPVLTPALQHHDTRPVLPQVQTVFNAAVSPDSFVEIMLLDGDDSVLYSTNPDRYAAPKRICPSRIICSFEFLTENGQTTLIVQYPLVGSDHEQVGSIVGLADTRLLNVIMGNRAGLGEDGSSYLLGAEHAVRWYPGVGPDMTQTVSVPVLNQTVQQSVPLVYNGVNGQTVQGVSSFVPRLFAWLIVEQPLGEIYQAVAILLPIALAIIALTVAAILLGSRWLTNRVTSPILALDSRVSQLELAIDKARDAEQVRSRAIANMGHELRTPINSILNFSGFLIDGLFGDLTTDQLEMMRQMHTGSQHLLDLINDLVDMSQVEAGQMRLFVKDFDPAPVFEQAISTLHSLTLEKPIQIQTDLPRSWPIIRGDRRRVLQILLNLVSNAAKFTDEGTITIRAHTYPARLVVRVEDSGPGVEAADLPLLFEPFRQGYNAQSNDKGGTGLGLPLSRILARMHGGDLEYQPGETGGTVFIFTLPLDATITAGAVNIANIANIASMSLEASTVTPPPAPDKKEDGPD